MYYVIIVHEATAAHCFDENTLRDISESALRKEAWEIPNLRYCRIFFLFEELRGKDLVLRKNLEWSPKQILTIVQLVSNTISEAI